MAQASGDMTSRTGKRLCAALSMLGDADEARALLVDLCTPGELADLAQRLEVATLLSEGQSYVAVSAATGASSTTVSRVSKCLLHGAGGYKIVLGRLDQGAGLA